MTILIVQNTVGISLGKCDQNKKLDDFTPMDYQSFLEKYDDFLINSPDFKKVLDSKKENKQQPGFLFVKEIDDQVQYEDAENLAKQYQMDSMVWLGLKMATMGFIQEDGIYIYANNKWYEQKDDGGYKRVILERPAFNDYYLETAEWHAQKLIDFIKNDDFHFEWSYLEACFDAKDDAEEWLQNLKRFWNYMLNCKEKMTSENSVKWRLRCIYNGPLPSDLFACYKMMQDASYFKRRKSSIIRKKEYRFIPKEYRINCFIHKRILFYTTEVVIMLLSLLKKYQCCPGWVYHVLFEETAKQRKNN